MCEGDNALSFVEILVWKVKEEEETLTMFKIHCMHLWNSQSINKIYAKISLKGNI